MPKMIQVRNVPDDVHRRLKVRAAEAGVSLSDYLLRIAEREADRPTVAELSERVRRRSRVDLPRGAVERMLRESRDERV